MKKLIAFLILAIGFFIMPVALFAANAVQETPVIDIGQYFVTLGALAGIVTILTQWIKQVVLKNAPNFLSWIIAVILSAVGWFLQFGIFVGVDWYWIFIYGLAAGLVSNGIFDINIILAILGIIPKKKE